MRHIFYHRSNREASDLTQEICLTESLPEDEYHREQRDLIRKIRLIVWISTNICYATLTGFTRKVNYRRKRKHSSFWAAGTWRIDGEVTWCQRCYCNRAAWPWSRLWHAPEASWRGASPYGVGDALVSRSHLLDYDFGKVYGGCARM